MWPNIRAFIWEANNLNPRNVGWFCVPDVPSEDSVTVLQFPPCAYGEIIGNHGFKTLKEYPEIPTIKLMIYGVQLLQLVLMLKVLKCMCN